MLRESIMSCALPRVTSSSLRHPPSTSDHGGSWFPPMDKTPAPQSKRLGCCGAIEKAKNEVRDKKARRNQPQPWIVLKFTVVLTFGILGYATYVYIGRVCLPMINEQGGASGSRTMGIAFLVVHCVLLAMVLWSYIKVVMTSPGKAKEHIEHSDRPRDASSQDHQDHDDDGNAIGGRSYEDITAMQQSETQRSVASSTLPGHAPPPLPVALPSQPPPQGNGVAPEKDINTGVLDAIPGAGHTDIEAQSPASASRRRPHMNPVLAPEFRYCGRDKLVKPPRAHHCRACATCILQYDHHCPWIGQCVGARNHKFFVNFLFWCIPYTYFLLATIIAINTPASGPQSTVDPQQIVIAALAGLFGLFTTTLLMTHVRLIMLNTTTVESLQIRSNQERETAQLNLMHGWWNFSAKKRTRKQWDQEWGHPHMEGNLWWLGSTRRNWEAKMGKSPFEWFFPIGHSESDGLSYPTNPRFDELGRQRRRKFWPLET